MHFHTEIGQSQKCISEHSQHAVHFFSAPTYHPSPVSWMWWFMSSVYTLYNDGDNCPHCLIPFQQRNVIDNEFRHLTINSCSLYQNTYINNSFFARVKWLSLSNAIFRQESTCIQVCLDYGKKSTVCLSTNMTIFVPCACLKPNWLSAVHRYLLKYLGESCGNWNWPVIIDHLLYSSLNKLILFQA